MFSATSLFISLGALCTHAQLVEDLIANETLSFISQGNDYSYKVLYYKSGDSIDILCKNNTAKEILLYWQIFVPAFPATAGKAVVQCGNGRYGPIRYRSRLRQIDHSNYLACMSADKTNSFTHETEADKTCHYMSEMLCPVSSTVESIAVTVNGRKLTTVSQKFLTVYDYTYYYNSSDSLQINCSIVNATVDYLSICGEIMDNNEFLACPRGGACAVTRTFRPGAGHRESVLYCYTLLLNSATQSVARLTLLYNESKPVSSDMTDINNSTYFETVIPLPNKKSNNNKEVRHGTGAANTTAEDAASIPGPVVYGIYALTVSSVLLVTASACVVCAYKKKKGNTREPDEIAEDLSASERVVENELYMRPERRGARAAPRAQARPEDRDACNKEQEAAYTYVNVNSVDQYRKPVDVIYTNSAVNTKKNLT